MAAFLRTVVLAAHLDRLPQGEREPLVEAVLERLDGGAIDFVRLHLRARRAG